MNLRARNNKIKCIFIIDRLMRFGGTEKHLYYLVNNLNKDIFSCCIIAFEATEHMKSEFREKKIELYNLELKKIYEPKAIKSFFLLVNKIRLIKPAIVQTFHFKSDTFGVFAAKIAGVPVIISSKRDTGALKTKRQIYLNRMFNHFITRYISVCNSVKIQISKTEHISNLKIRTIYNGIDLKELGYDYEVNTAKIRTELNLDMNSFIIGVVCMLRPEKNVKMIFEAIYSIKNKLNNFTLLIVGDGLLKSDLVQFAQKNNFYANTIFTGYVKDVRKYVQAMDVFCFTPDRNEGFSNAVLEAMAYGKAIIATNIGGNNEAVLNHQTGLIIEPNDARSLESSILNLYQNSLLRQHFGQSAKKRVKSLFTLKRMIHETEHYYMESLNSRN